MPMARRLVREHEIAALVSKSIRTMQGLRRTGGGPPFVKIGGSIRYDLVALEKFLAQNTSARISKEKSSS